jgi:hypothetical protein
VNTFPEDEEPPELVAERVELIDELVHDFETEV